MELSITAGIVHAVPSASPPANGVHVVAASAGFIAFLLVWVALLWGLVLRNGWAFTRVRPSSLLAVHGGLGLTGLCLGLVHGLAQAAAPVTATRLRDVVVPFLNLDDPAWGDLPRAARAGEGIGTLALEVMVASTLATAIQSRLGVNRWRALHQLNHVGYLLMVVHVLVSGSDAGHPWAWVTVLGTVVVTAATWLATTDWGRGARRRGEQALGVARPGTRLAIEVDPVHCARFGFCEHEAPDTFRLTGDGRLTYEATVPVEQAEGVVRAARVCPARAIRLGQEATEVVMGPPTPQSGALLLPFDASGGRR